MSDTNRVQLSYAKTVATAFPVTLAPNELNLLRLTATPNLGYVPQTKATNEIRSDRQVSDLILVGAEAGGDAAIELSAEAFDDFTESALMSTWGKTPNKTGASEIVSFGAGTVTVDDDADFIVGMIFRLDGETVTDAGEGVYLISAVAANVITAAPWDANTNALAATMTSVATTSIRVCGYQAIAAGEIDIDVTTGTLTIGASGASSFDDLMGLAVDFVPGQWVKLSGFDGPENDLWVQLVTVASLALTAVAQTGMVTEATAGSAVIWFGDYVRNGAEAVSAHQYLIERRFSDHSPVTRETFLGMSVNQFNYQLTPQSIAVGAISFMGLTAGIDDVPANLYVGGAPTDIPSPEFEVYDTANDIGRIGRGVDAVDVGGNNYVLEATVNINNNLRRRNAVGVLGAVSLGVGEFTVTGSLNTYFDNKDLVKDLFDNVESSFDFVLVGGDGRGAMIDMPRIKWSGGAPDVSGKNQDVVVALGYQAIRDATLDYTLQAQTFAYTE
jgi:hypothetical protein